MTAVATAINFLTLLVGLACGYVLHEYMPPRAFAQTSQKIEEIQPMATFPTAAVGTLLVGRLAADEISVRGVNLVKLHENTLNLIAQGPVVGGWTAADIQRVINNSKSDTILRMKEPTKPKEQK